MSEGSSPPLQELSIHMSIIVLPVAQIVRSDLAHIERPSFRGVGGGHASFAAA